LTARPGSSTLVQSGALRAHFGREEVRNMTEIVVCRASGLSV
jgi:hypothetical protein